MNHTSRAHRSPEQWQQIIEQQISSGMSQKAFCRSQHLCPGTFSNWKRRLMPTDGKTFQGSAAQTEKEWIELPASTSKPSPWAMELELPGGVILRMRA